MKMTLRELARSKISIRVLSILLTAALCFCLLTPAMAADKAKTIRLIRTEGTVTVTNSSGENLDIWEDMRLYSGDHVTTAAESYAYLMLDEAKAAKMDASTDVEVRSRGRKLELLLNSGNIYFGVSVPLEEDENLNIRTSSIAMGIRGTAGWVEAIEEGHSKVYILEGTVTGTVTDPVSGQSKSTTLHGGECADFYTYDASVPGDKVAIVRGQFTRGDIGGYVLKEVAGKDELIQKIYDDSGIDLRDLTAEEASAALAADEAAASQEGEEPEEDEEEEEVEAEKTPVWKTGGSGGGDGSGGGASAPAVIVVREPAEASESYTLSGSGSDFTLAASTDSHVKANGDGTYSVESDPTSGTNVNLTLTPADGYMVAEKDDVTVYSGTTALPDFTVTEGEPGRITGTANIAKDTAITMDGLYYKVTDASGIASALASNDRVAVADNLALDSDLTIPSGKTLLVFTGKTVRVDAGTALTIQGTLVNKGTIENYGTIANKSNHTLLNEGTIKNFGDIENGDEDEEGRIINEGVIRNDETSGASITNAAGSEIANGGSITNGGSGTIDNAGRLENTSSGTIANTGAITNTGDIVNDGAIKGEEGTIDSTDGNLITTTDAVNENMVEGEVEIKAGNISTAVIGQGTLTADKKTAGAGERVSLTVMPDSGYELTSLLVLSAADGTERTITGDAFTMPEGDVVAIAVFSEKAKEAEEPEEPEEPEAIYHVIIPGTTGGSVTASPSADLAEDAAVTLTVEEYSGYQLAGLSVYGADGTLISTGKTFRMPPQDVLVIASFTEPENEEPEEPGETEAAYDVIVLQTDGGTLAAAAGAEPAEELSAGESVTLIAVPDDGFDFASFLVVKASDGTSVDIKNNAFDMPDDDVIAVALFTEKAKLYNLTIEAKYGSVRTTTGETSFPAGELVQFSVTETENGYVFDHLAVTTANGPIPVDADSRFVMPASDAEVTAVFRAEDAPATHHIYIVTPQNDAITQQIGTITAMIGDEEVSDAIEGDTVTLVIDPADGYELLDLFVVNLRGTPIDFDFDSSTFSMQGEDVVVMGLFTPILYPIAVTVSGNGTIRTEKEAFPNDQVALKVIPAEGFQLDQYDSTLTIKDGSGGKINYTYDSTKDIYEFSMPASAVEISAAFIGKAYEIKAETCTHGRIDFYGETLPGDEAPYASAGDTVLIKIKPEEGYVLDTLKINNGEIYCHPIGNSGVLSFTMPAENVTITASFAPGGSPNTGSEHIVTISSMGNGTLYASAGGNYSMTIPDSLSPYPRLVACAGDRVDLISLPGNDAIDQTYDSNLGLVSCTYSYKVSGETINNPITPDNDGSLWFTMPDSDVTIEAVYAMKGSMITGNLAVCTDIQDCVSIVDGVIKVSSPSSYVYIESLHSMLESSGSDANTDDNAVLPKVIISGSPSIRMINAEIDSLTLTEGEFSLYSYGKSDIKTLVLRKNTNLSLETGTVHVASITYEDNSVINVYHGVLYVDMKDIPQTKANGESRPLIAVYGMSSSGEGPQYIEITATDENTTFSGLLFIQGSFTRITDADTGIRYTPVIPYMKSSNDSYVIGYIRDIRLKVNSSLMLYYDFSLKGDFYLYPDSKIILPYGVYMDTWYYKFYYSRAHLGKDGFVFSGFSYPE